MVCTINSKTFSINKNTILQFKTTNIVGGFFILKINYTQTFTLSVLQTTNGKAVDWRIGTRAETRVIIVQVAVKSIRTRK